MIKSKKGQTVFARLGELGVGIAVLAIVLTITFLIIAEGQDQIVTLDGINETNDSTKTVAYNATVTLANAVSDIPDWIPLIVIASIGAILLGLVALFRNRG